MMHEERDLRDALRARAAAVPVGRADERGLIGRLGAARRRRQMRLAGAAAVLAVILGAAGLVAADDDQGPNVVAGPDPSSTTTTALEPSTTTVDTTTVETAVALPLPAPTTAAPTVPGSVPTTVPRTTPTTVPLPPVPDDALWPSPGSTTTFSTAERATEDFARRFLGMGTPQLSPGRVTVRGDEALFDLRPLPTASVTTLVQLRRIDRRGWVVVGCSADTIQVDRPAGGTRVTSPLTVAGRAQAFEGTVAVEVRRDGATAPIGESFGTGASDTMAPFETAVTFARPSTARGTLVVSEPRADDASQGPLAATVLRIAF